MNKEPIMCLLCDGVMAVVDRYEKHLRIDHRVVSRMNWIIQNTGNIDAHIKKEVIETNSVKKSGESGNDEENDSNGEAEFVEEEFENESTEHKDNDIEDIVNTNIDDSLNVENDGSENAMDHRSDNKESVGGEIFSAALIINPRSDSNEHQEGYGCSLCPRKLFKKKDKARRHMRVHIPEEDRDKVLCLDCHKGFLNSDSLKEHMKVCTGVKEIYICPEKFCGASIEDNESVMHHKKSHKGESKGDKQYPCDSCERIFKRKDHLKRHIKGAHTDNPFACESCEKVFTRIDHLNRHAVSHTETDNQFSCEVCQKTFGRKESMIAHKKVAHQTNVHNI